MAGKAKTVKKTVVTKNTDKDIVFDGAIKTVVETPPPPKSPKKNEDVEYIGNELANVSTRVNELELTIEDMNQKLKRVMGRMGL
tara:strand:- start:231 stop:482 length:252 start_codon:yes stop_codon:yes gene_type:complete